MCKKSIVPREGFRVQLFPRVQARCLPHFTLICFIFLLRSVWKGRSSTLLVILELKWSHISCNLCSKWDSSLEIFEVARSLDAICFSVLYKLKVKTPRREGGGVKFVFTAVGVKGLKK